MPIVLLGRRVRDVSRHSQDRIADLGSIVAETLGAMKIVQAFGQEERESSRFRDAVHARLRRPRGGGSLLRALLTAIVIAMMFGSITMLMRQAAIDVSQGAVSGGTVAAFVITGAIVAGAFGALTEVYGELLRGAGATGADRRADGAGAADPGARQSGAAARARARHARVRRGHLPLSDPARRSARCTSSALRSRPARRWPWSVRRAPARSTIFQLAQRFYDPDEGAIRLDGVELREADPAAIRARIAVVPQETMIFAASARDNLRYGRWEAGDDELWAAAEAANAAEFLRGCPRGSTPISARAARASPAASASASPSPARCCATRLCCCSTRRPRRSTPNRSGWSRARSSGWSRGGRRSSSPTASPPSAPPTGSSSWTMAGSSRKALTTPSAPRGGLYARLARLQFEGLAA